MKRVAIVYTSLVLCACASNPKDIEPAYISPLPYENLTCIEIEDELQRINVRTDVLYKSLKKEYKKDDWKVAGGIFIPIILLSLSGGDGPEAMEYARLQGETNALNDIKTRKRCVVSTAGTAPGPDAYERIKRRKE
jgi:hypothetical protein